jgi:hypothetical protein
MVGGEGRAGVSSKVFNLSTREIYFVNGIEGCAYSTAGIVERCPRCKRLGEKRVRRLKRRTVYRFVHVARVVRTREEGRPARNRFEIISKCDVPEEEANRVDVAGAGA